VLHEWATEPKEFHELRNRINGLADWWEEYTKYTLFVN
jgi:hypothetical protein